MMLPEEIKPLVSVVIPCYNYGTYLRKAIESVLEQQYENIEIIVIDDGSSDNTKEICSRFSNVKYHHQINKGLPASRNKGIKISKGDYLVFLDADDWLYPNAIETNLDCLGKNEAAQFVSGSYENVFENTGRTVACTNEITGEPYIHFLKNNYVGVPAAVMFRRKIFDEFLFDETLKSCEDYDLYLKISRKYPVIHHNRKIAAYRKHESNMSGNFFVMLSTALEVLHRQKKMLKTAEEKVVYANGRRFWKLHFARKLYESLLSGGIKLSSAHVSFLFKNNPVLLIKILIRYPFL